MFACAFVVVLNIGICGFAVLQELAQQIKAYQARINELSEKSHELAERSADLGPLCARKLYHSGFRDTTVSELVDALNAPLEPYVSPLPSPRSPSASLKYQYENPIKLSKSTDGHLNSLPSDTSFLTNGTSRLSDALSRSLPSFDPKTSSAKPGRGDQQRQAGTGLLSSPRGGIGVSPTDSGINFSSLGSGLSDFKSPRRLSNAEGTESMEVASSVPKSYASFPSKRAHSEERESGTLPSKSLKSSDSLESASVRTGSGSAEEPGSVVAQLEDQIMPKSAVVTKQAPYSTRQSAPDKGSPSWRKGDAAGHKLSGKSAEEGPKEKENIYKDSKSGKFPGLQSETSELLTPEELKVLEARKKNALTPYQSKYYHIAAIDKDSGDEKTPGYEGEFDSLANDFERPGPDDEDNDNMMVATGEEPTKEKFDFKTWKARRGSKDSKTGPVKAEHRKFAPLSSWAGKSLDRSRSESPKGSRESDSSPDYTLSQGRKSYQPRSPSPLTLDSHSPGTDEYGKPKYGMESARGSGYGQWSDRGRDHKPASHTAADKRSLSMDGFSGSKSGSQGALPSLSVYTGTESPISRFSSSDGIDRHSRSWSQQGRGEDKDSAAPKTGKLSKSLTTQGIRALQPQTDTRKAGGGGGLLQQLYPGKRDTVGG